MSQPQAKFNVAITSSDKTDKGAKSAEKRMGQIPKRAGAANRAQAKADQDSYARSSRGILRTLAGVEQASARVFGGRSMTAGFASRLAGVSEAAAATGEGLGAAATGGSALSAALGVVGVVAGATVGILAAAGFAAYKLVDGWAKGASQIGRTADTIGVATDALQKFTAASERVGVDKGTAIGAIGSLSQTLNDANYGKNGTALGILGKTGVKLEHNADGTVDVGKMLPAIADAVMRQNSSGQRTVLQALGIPLAARAAFAQGGAALSADMADAGGTAYIASTEDVARAKRIDRKGTIVGQMAGLAAGKAGSGAADLAEPIYDATIAGGRGAIGGASSFPGIVKGTFAPAAEKIERGATRIATAIAPAAEKIDRAASKMLSAAGLSGAAKKNNNAGNMRPVGGGGFQRFDTVDQSIAAMGRQIRIDQNRHGARNIEELIAGRVGPDGKRHWGWAPASDHNDTDAYVRNVSKRTGFAPTQSIDFSDPAVLTALIQAIITQENGKNAYSREQIAGAIGQIPIPVKVEVAFKNAPAGTRAHVTAGHGKAPAVSHALQN